MSTPFTLPIIRGDTATFRFDLQDDEGEAFDLTGSTITFECEQEDGTNLSLVTGSDSEITMATPSNGQVTLTLSDTHTAAFSLGLQNRYQLRRSISGEVKTLVYGLVLAKDVI